MSHERNGVSMGRFCRFIFVSGRDTYTYIHTYIYIYTYIKRMQNFTPCLEQVEDLTLLLQEVLEVGFGADTLRVQSSV